MGDGRREGYCRSCKAPVVWVIGSGDKWHICNPPRKMFVLQGGVHVLQDCFESHFATCKDADMWRQKKVV